MLKYVHVRNERAWALQVLWLNSFDCALVSCHVRSAARLSSAARLVLRCIGDTRQPKRSIFHRCVCQALQQPLLSQQSSVASIASGNGGALCALLT
jgi:hypothetical protein